MSVTFGELNCRKWLKTAREATNSGCPSYIGFEKCAPVDSARILAPSETHNKKWIQPTQGTIFGAVDCCCVLW